MIHDAVCRTLQQHVDLLNGRLADSSLQVEHLKAEIVKLHSAQAKKQPDTDTSQTAASLAADLADHDIQPNHDDLAKDIDILRAQASNHTFSVFDHCQHHMHPN